MTHNTSLNFEKNSRHDASVNLDFDPSALQGLNERDIEMDNLKTIIVALNQKVKAREDLEY